MKNFLKTAFFALFSLCMVLPASAKKDDSGNLPVDPSIRIGKLKNGLTYYLRHNARPEGKADFYIAQKVGSIQEEDNQRGLAHFLEHMCFNGTEKFPGDALINYLENIGVKFGVNLNAYTSIDETVYNINNVPLNIEGALDSCLWILHDWADGLILDHEEIDKERGVIHEEWRQRNTSGMRLLQQVLPAIYPGNRYGERMPIGTMEVVDNFPYQALRDYYEKWYRPDLQGIIIVGDIDVDDVEKKIKKIFSKIKKAKKPAERIYYPVEDNKEMIFAQATDKEQQNYYLSIMYKHDATPREQRNTAKHLYESLCQGLATSMLNERFSEMMPNNPPFLAAGVGYSSYMLSNTKSAFTISLHCKPERIMEAVPAVLTEVERAKRYGFTPSELERKKASYMAFIDSWYAERDKRENNYYVEECVRHFLDNSDMMSPEKDYEFTKNAIEKLTLEEINAVIPSLIRDENCVVISYAPEKENAQYPGKNDLQMLMKSISQTHITEYVDETNEAPLLSSIPEGDKITKTTEGKWGETVWTFDSGVKVVVKPTDFKADQVALVGFSKGGTNRYPDCDNINIGVMNNIVSLGGLGDFDAITLGKKLAGNTAGARVWATDIFDRADASCAPKDIETMFQLLYLSFTAPRKDSAAFESYKTRLYGSLRDRNLNPGTALNDTIKKALFDNHPRAKTMLAEDVERIDYDRIMEMHKDRISDISDFTFIIVGNVDLATLKPLVEKYIGALPANGRMEEIVDDGVDVRKGKYTNHFRNKMETPTTSEVIIYSGEVEGTQRNALMMSYLSQILNIVYTEEVREKESGTYGVGVSGSVSKYPKEEFSISIQFQMAPERREELTAIVLRELDKVAKEGPKEEHIEKVRSYMLKSFEESQISNSAWTTWLYKYHFDNEDVYTNYTDLIKSVTKEDLRLFLNKLLEQGNMIELSMSPEI